MSFENDLHDWHLDGVMTDPSGISLFVHLYEARKEIRLKNVTGCLIDNFMGPFCNIIFEAKIISANEHPDLYESERARLDEMPRRDEGEPPRIFSISASLGANATIEFQDLEVTEWTGGSVV